jgi:hypothetical protein
VPSPACSWWASGASSGERSPGVATVGLSTFAVAGLLNACPADLPGESTTWHGVVHGIGFISTMLAILLGFTASGLALRDNPDWRHWRLLGWLPVLFGVMALTKLGLPGDTGWYLFLVLAFGWFTAIGTRLYQLARRDTARTPAGTQAATAQAPGLL